MKLVPIDELITRMDRFREEMDKMHPQWETAIIFSKINLFYFTGTMQEGMLYIPRNGKSVYFVRRSLERALDESDFADIIPMTSFREAAAYIGNVKGHVYLEMEIVPLAMYKRLLKYFPFDDVKPLDSVISSIRSVKSKYELDLIKKSGAVHKKVLEDIVPNILKAGMSEADLAGELYAIMLQEGHHGLARFGMFDTDIGMGQIGFGESSLYPTSFNGPGGNYGISPAVPFIGSRERKLENGSLVFVDVGCGVDGYHTDKTMTYIYNGKLPKEAVDIHKQCVSIQNRIAEMLRPGAIPSQIYRNIMKDLTDEFKENFMGFGSRKVKFLGHGIGLVIDEYPVIAEGFDEPLKEGMVIAVEPKKGIKDVGMVGIENTFIVTSEGGICVTGDSTGLIHCG